MITPVDLGGEQQSIVFQVAHASPEATVYWHLDNSFVATTNENHEIELSPEPGPHTLTIVDDDGNRLSRHFNIID